MKRNLIEPIKKGWIWLIILFLISFGIFLIKDLFSSVKKIEKNRGEIQRNVAFLDNLATLQVEEREAEKYFERMKQFVPKEEEVFEIIDDLERRAKRWDLEAQFQFGDVKKEKKLKWILLEFALEGDFYQLLNYFEELKRAPYFVSIDDFKLSFVEEKKLYYFNGEGKLFLRNVE